jgi:xanthine dehydrogenase accessory factor
MTDVFSEIVVALRNQESVVLATIVASSGSTPLPSGSSMLVKRNGKIVLGTIGGGPVEANVVTEAKEFFARDLSSVIKQFELSEGDLEVGMICGGTIDVLIEKITPSGLPLFSQLINSRDAGSDCILLRGVDLTKSDVGRLIVDGAAQQSLQFSQSADLLEAHGVSVEQFLPILQRSHREESVGRVSGLKGELIIQPILGSQPLIIFGGGHVGRCLSRLAALSGFSVMVVDDRAEYAQQSRFPEAAQTISKSWSEAFGDLKIHPATSIVIVTRGHQSDAEVLHQAVMTSARYIGMIGSKKKVAATFTRLLKVGVPLPELKRIHAPIGLDIGAVTAEEIAVSILAELIRARRGFQSVSAPMSAQMNSWFDQVDL